MPKGRLHAPFMKEDTTPWPTPDCNIRHRLRLDLLLRARFRSSGRLGMRFLALRIATDRARPGGRGPAFRCSGLIGAESAGLQPDQHVSRVGGHHTGLDLDRDREGVSGKESTPEQRCDTQIDRTDLRIHTD